MRLFYHFWLLAIVLILSCIYKCLWVAGFITIASRFLFCTTMCLLYCGVAGRFNSISVVAIVVVIALVWSYSLNSFSFLIIATFSTRHSFPPTLSSPDWPSPSSNYVSLTTNSSSSPSPKPSFPCLSLPSTCQTPPSTSSPTSFPSLPTPSPSHKGSSPTAKFISIYLNRSFTVSADSFTITFFISSSFRCSSGWISGCGAIVLFWATVILLCSSATCFVSTAIISFASIISLIVSLFLSWYAIGECFSSWLITCFIGVVSFIMRRCLVTWSWLTFIFIVIRLIFIIRWFLIVMISLH